MVTTIGIVQVSLPWTGIDLEIVECSTARSSTIDNITFIFVADLFLNL